MKKRKREENGVIITSDNDYSGNGLALAIKLWDLLHSTDFLQREINKLIQQLRLDAWLNIFLTDLAMYKGLHHQVLARIPKEDRSLSVHLRLAGTNFFIKNYEVRCDSRIGRFDYSTHHRVGPLYFPFKVISNLFSFFSQAMFDYIFLVACSLPDVPGKVSYNLTVPSMRHLHYLTLARFPILQYCCRLLLLAIKV